MARGDLVQDRQAPALGAYWAVQPPAGQMWLIFDVWLWGTTGDTGYLQLYNDIDGRWTATIFEVSSTMDSYYSVNKARLNMPITNYFYMRLKKDGTYSGKYIGYLGMQVA